MDYKEKVIALLNSQELSKEQKEKLEEIFPELAESDDEAIRKAIINVFATHKDYEVFFGVSVENILAWLEKQGERMSDPRYSILDKLIEADGIYQMAMNDAMVQEAKTKAIDALSKLEIGKLLEIEKQGEQKSAWSEEDDIKALNRISTILVDASEVKNWWKEYRLIERDEMIRLTDFLKSLKDRVQPKREWNEEDELMLKYAIEHFERQKRNCIDGGGRKKAMQEFIDWLKSLRPQSQWKPSDEQMSALSKAIAFVFDSNSDVKHSLESLYNELKKL